MSFSINFNNQTSIKIEKNSKNSLFDFMKSLFVYYFLRMSDDDKVPKKLIERVGLIKKDPKDEYNFVDKLGEG